jgi:SAM-dependent methyltransferase
VQEKGVSAGWRGLALVCPRCRGVLEGQATGALCPACGAAFGEDDGILGLVCGRHGRQGYDPHYFDTLQRIEDRHFWFIGRRQALLTALRRHVPDLRQRRLFDVGCGSGGLLAFLGRSGVPLAGACDVYPESLRLVRRHLDVPLVLVDDGEPPPLGPGGHDLIGMFDVLEHLDDDLGALRALRRGLSPGGVLALTVPAHAWLFDEMDELAYHRRRYSRRGLATLLRRAGFEVRAVSHFMAPLVPPLLLLRSLGRALRGRNAAPERRALEFRVVPGINEGMRAVLAVERVVMRVAPVPFGSSLVAVAAVPGGVA